MRDDTLIKDNEQHGPALRAFLASKGPEPQLVSSVLLKVEARRGILRTSPRNLPRVDLLLSDVFTIPISEMVVDRASRLPDSALRSLDALHLATALLIREDVEALLTYDERVATTAGAQRMTVVAPT